MQKNKIKFKEKNIENTVKASRVSLDQQINCKCVGANCVRPNSKGITLVALVITIIVMLILIGVTVSTVLKGDLFNIAKRESVETRASMVEEKVAEWKANKKIDEYLEENSNTQSLEELLNDLETQQLITNEERKEIEENMEVKIGDKEIELLPDGYTRLEYLETTGTQWIDTGFIPKINAKLEMEVSFNGTFQPKEKDYNNFIFGVGDSNSSFHINFGGAKNQGNELFCWCEKRSKDENRIRRLNISDVIRLNRNKITFQSKKITYAGLSAQIATRVSDNIDSLVIFGVKIQGTCYPFGAYNMKLYSCRLYNGDSLERNLIPYLDETKTPCMYDTVTGQTFYNQGTGEFIAGYKN